MNPVTIFLSYAHQDEAFKNELVEFLAPLSNAGKIAVWNDREILVGDEWNQEIIKALNEAQLILFLISPAFLASSYINKVEITKAMERHESGQVRLVPVMIRKCDFNSHVVEGAKYRINDFQGVPTNLKPITHWPIRDDGWMDVVKGLHRVLDKMENTKP